LSHSSLHSELSPEVQAQRKPEHDLDPQFLNRWSPRSFLSKPVPDEALMSVFEAARWAPSGSNQQPWRYIVARSEEDRAVFHSFIVEGNLEWCKRAPVLVLLASERLTSNGNPNPSHLFDAGTSWGYLALEAARQGLITHAMGGFHKDAAKQALQLPETIDPCIVIAIGYRGPLEQLTEPQQSREKPSPRRDMTEILHEGQFGLALRKE
jgi:nitroreductase